jgi:hypothetical protein
MTLSMTKRDQEITNDKISNDKWKMENFSFSGLFHQAKLFALYSSIVFAGFSTPGGSGRFENV